MPVVADVLDDHVDVDALVGERLEDRAGDPGSVWDTDERHLGHLAVESHRADLVTQLHGGHLPDRRAGMLAEGRADADDHAVDEAELDRARLHHLGALVGELEHLLVVDLIDEPRVGDDPRVGRVDALDVGVDLAAVGAEGRGEGHGGRIGSAATERRHLAEEERLVGRALEAGHDDDAALLELLADAQRLDVRDPGAPMAPVGPDARLGSGQRDRVHAERLERHRDERAAHVLASREEQVHLARVRLVGDGGRERDEVVGGIAHRADDDHEVGAVAAVSGDSTRDVPDALGIGERGAAVLLDDESGHARKSTRARVRTGGALSSLASTVAPVARGRLVRARPARPRDAARSPIAAATRVASVSLAQNAMIVEPAPDRHAPRAPAARAAATISGSSG